MTSRINIHVHTTQGATVHIHPEPIGELPQGTLLENDAARTLEWIDDICGDVVTFEEAEKAVANLGNGWRMPTREELESCLDLSRYDPAVDPEKHPHVKSEWYWSSTPCAWSSDRVWVVAFDSGDVFDFFRGTAARVRAVRSVSSQ